MKAQLLFTAWIYRSKSPMQQNGRAALFYYNEVQRTILEAQDSAMLKPVAAKLANAATQLQEVTAHLIHFATQEKPEVFLADATLYLELFGTIAIAWQWLKQAIAADKALSNAAGDDIIFYKSKLQLLQIFLRIRIAENTELTCPAVSTERVTLEVKAEEIV